MSEDNPPADHVVVDDDHQGNGIEDHVKSRPTWLRFVFMLVFYVLAAVAASVATVVIVLGFFWVLFTGEKNERLQRLGKGVVAYIYEIGLYLTYNSEVRPFPFEADWPTPGEEG